MSSSPTVAREQTWSRTVPPDLLDFVGAELFVPDDVPDHLQGKHPRLHFRVSRRTESDPITSIIDTQQVERNSDGIAFSPELTLARSQVALTSSCCMSGRRRGFGPLQGVKKKKENEVLTRFVLGPRSHMRPVGATIGLTWTELPLPVNVFTARRHLMDRSYPTST